MWPGPYGDFGSRKYLIASLDQSLKRMGLDYVDVLMLGYHPGKPRKQVMELALNLKEKGEAHHLALSGHNRKLFPKLMEEKEIGVFQVRYNAANRGAEKDVFPFHK